MAQSNIYDDGVTVNKDKLLYKHSANPFTKVKNWYTFWQFKEEISAEEFQELYVGLLVGCVQDTLMKICKPINTGLMKG